MRISRLKRGFSLGLGIPQLWDRRMKKQENLSLDSAISPVREIGK
jgi:hypothetical protein